MGRCSTCGKEAETFDIEVGGEFMISFCEDCLDEMVKSLSVKNDEKKTVDDKSDKIDIKTPVEIKSILDEYVIGQEEAKKTIAVGIYNHYKRIASGKTNIKKSNILMVGPTGVGKTEIARTVAKVLDVPFCICDATTVTEAGYVGDDVENILLRLIQAADMDIEKAEKGIIYIDEIDKIARKSENVSITRDVSGEGVQQALLKIIEGAEVDVAITGGRKHPQGDRVRIDTSNILFICGGAFEGLTMNNTKEKVLGFNKEAVENKQDSNKITAKDIEKNGIIPELAGRLPIIVKLNALTKEDLKRILIEPKNSIVKQYTELVELDNVKLKFTDESLEYIASKAYDNGTGARGLRCIIEQFMVDLMFEIPSDNNISSITITVANDELSYKKHYNRKTA